MSDYTFFKNENIRSAGLYYQCKYVMPRANMHDLETDELYKLKCAIKFLLRLQITLYNVN